jgi:DNA-binding transcriptional ArsR family regulator
MHAFDVLGDPVRRRILELLADREHASGEVVDVIQAEFGLSQPAVSQHLKVLREARLVTMRAEGTRRLYAIDAAGVDAAQTWLARLSDPFRQPLDALETEVARGKRATAVRRATERGRRRRSA